MLRNWKDRKGYTTLRVGHGSHFRISDSEEVRAHKKEQRLIGKSIRLQRIKLRYALKQLVKNSEERNHTAWLSKHKISLKIIFAALVSQDREKARGKALENFRIYNKTKRVRKHPSYYAPNHAKRRALKVSATLPSTDYDLIKEFFIESKDKTESTGLEYHVDHIIPLVVGGSHHQDNLQAILASENMSKQAQFKKEDTKVLTRWALNKQSINNKFSPHYGKKCTYKQ